MHLYRLQSQVLQLLVNVCYLTVSSLLVYNAQIPLVGYGIYIGLCILIRTDLILCPIIQFPYLDGSSVTYTVYCILKLFLCSFQLYPNICCQILIAQSVLYFLYLTVQISYRAVSKCFQQSLLFLNLLGNHKPFSCLGRGLIQSVVEYLKIAVNVPNGCCTLFKAVIVNVIQSILPTVYKPCGFPKSIGIWV